jgi:hypothetical protein
MSTVYELRNLLNNLIEAWPEDSPHPAVEQAREYLDDVPAMFLGAAMIDAQSQTHSDNDDFHSAMWYSL